MPTTPGGINYPSSSDSIDIPGDFQTLALDVESFINTNAVTASGAATLTNKTLTAPKFADGGFIADANGNELIILDTVTSAVNEITVANAITSNAPTITASGSDTNISLNLVPKGTGKVNAGGVNLVTISSTDTLTNKTLTSPVLGGTTTTASGNLVIDPATQIVEVYGDGVSVVGQIQLNCHVNSHGQVIASQPHSEAATNVLTLPGGTTIGNANAVLVSNTGTQTLTNKTLSGGIIADAVVKGLEEDVNVVASAATGTINFDVETASIWYYTSNATANHTLNFRYSSSVSLNTAMATGDAITLVWLNTNGATAYYPNVINIDGSAVTPKVPVAIAAGNASAIDVYSFTIIKTASATFTVLETQTKFA
jgi:hypothetical protein